MKWLNVREILAQVGKSLPGAVIELALPATCGGCGRTGSWVCESCEQALIRVPRSGCYRCGRKGQTRRECESCSSLFPTRLKYVRSAFVYGGPMRHAVQRFKYNGEYQRGYDLGERLRDCVADLLPRRGVDLIVPVPLHSRRYRSRGFNQSALLASRISEELAAPVVHPVIRTKNTMPQVRLKAHERRTNLEQAFAFSDEHAETIHRKTILLVDDVMTTGATLSALALALQEAGSGDLYGVTLAREH